MQDISALHRAFWRMELSSLIYLLCMENSKAPVSRRRLSLTGKLERGLIMIVWATY